MKTCPKCRTAKHHQEFRIISTANRYGDERRAGWCLTCEQEYRQGQSNRPDYALSVSVKPDRIAQGGTVRVLIVKR